jgi:hypothetical protein
MATFTGWLGTSDSQSGQLLNGFDSVQPEVIPSAAIYSEMQGDTFARWRKRFLRGNAWMEPITAVEDALNKISQELILVDKFEGRWGNPFIARRRRPLTQAIYGAAILERTLVPEAPEGGTIRPWHTEFSQPVRVPTHRRPLARFVPMQAPELDAADRFEFTFVEWLVPMGHPAALLRRRGIRPGNATIGQLEMDAADRPEKINADAWYVPFGRPVPPRPRIRAANTTLGRLEMDPADRLEQITLDKFYTPLSRHPGKKPMPRRPWNIAFEEYDESGFEIPLALRLHREMYAGGY